MQQLNYIFEDNLKKLMQIKENINHPKFYHPNPTFPFHLLFALIHIYLLRNNYIYTALFQEVFLVSNRV